ncbi:nucleotidyltransferase domain-containing protein [Catellatospora coxensis]
MDLAQRLRAVPGVVAVVLGGSRARGEHRPDSDTDLGLYYRGPLDVDALRSLAAQVATAHDVYRPGEWGPWVDGGGWLTVDGQAVDWIYRDLDRVRAVWDDCRAGRYTVERQVGHPLGFYSHAYAGRSRCAGSSPTRPGNSPSCGSRRSTTRRRSGTRWSRGSGRRSSPSWERARSRRTGCTSRAACSVPSA